MKDGCGKPARKLATQAPSIRIRKYDLLDDAVNHYLPLLSFCIGASTVLSEH